MVRMLGEKEEDLGSNLHSAMKHWMTVSLFNSAYTMRMDGTIKSVLPLQHSASLGHHGSVTPLWKHLV